MWESPSGSIKKKISFLQRLSSRNLSKQKGRRYAQSIQPKFSTKTSMIFTINPTDFVAPFVNIQCTSLDVRVKTLS